MKCRACDEEVPNGATTCPACGEAVVASSGPQSPTTVKMRCPNCGINARGRVDQFARPVTCPKCKVRGVFTPAEGKPRGDTGDFSPVAQPAESMAPAVTARSQPSGRAVAGGKLSGLALATLITGLCSILCSFFTGIVSIVLGAIVLSRKTSSPKDRQFAITGMALGMVLSVVMLAICIFAEQGQEEKGNTVPGGATSQARSLPHPWDDVQKRFDAIIIAKPASLQPQMPDDLLKRLEIVKGKILKELDEYLAGKPDNAVFAEYQQGRGNVGQKRFDKAALRQDVAEKIDAWFAGKVDSFREGDHCIMLTKDVMDNWVRMPTLGEDEYKKVMYEADGIRCVADRINRGRVYCYEAQCGAKKRLGELLEKTRKECKPDVDLINLAHGQIPWDIKNLSDQLKEARDPTKLAVTVKALSGERAPWDDSSEEAKVLEAIDRQPLVEMASICDMLNVDLLAFQEMEKAARAKAAAELDAKRRKGPYGVGYREGYAVGARVRGACSGSWELDFKLGRWPGDGGLLAEKAGLEGEAANGFVEGYGDGLRKAASSY